jgi:hypothetical protein
MRCPECDIVFEDLLLTFEEMKALVCPVCETAMTMLPARFKFDVKDSARAERQKLEHRFKKRERRIEREFTPAQAERFERFCRARNCRRSF